MYKLLRRGSGRMLVLCAVLLSLLLCLYYVSQTQQGPNVGAGSAAIIADGAAGAGFDRVLTSVVPDYSEPPDAQVSPDTCPLITPRDADIDAQAEFEKFDFQPSWMRSREYWDDSFERRYAELKKDPRRPPLKMYRQIDCLPGNTLARSNNIFGDVGKKSILTS